MVSFVRIRDRLPSLYRPQPGDTSLLTLLLRTLAKRLEELDVESSQVMQAHWFDYADRALYNPFFLRSRDLLKQPPPALSNPVDRIAIEEFPYIHDLARLGSLVGLSPWREPPYLREGVEEYRLRIARTVKLYRNGLGTRQALRSMVEAQLPVNLSALAGQEDRPFWLEEFAPLVRTTFAVTQPGPPVDMVGPLMRWTVQNDGLEATPLTLYIKGVTPQEGLTDATATPLVELYQVGSQRPRFGIAYQNTVAPGETLRLRPAFTSWLGTENGILLAKTSSHAETMADPTAPGPWQAVEDAPAQFAGATVVAIHQTADQMLWFAVNGADAVGTLWRYDGGDWTLAMGDLPLLHALAEEKETLLIGTASGLQQMALYPEDGADFVANPVADVGNQPVRAIFAATDGQIWFGTGNGLIRRIDNLDGTQVYEPFVLHENAGIALAVHAIAQDTDASGNGTFYFGTSLALFQFQPRANRWYWYAGEQRTEQIADWQEFHPDQEGDAQNLPVEERHFLPTVLAIRRGPDASLWLGTEQGIPRYVARSVSGFTYETVLEAFPDLLTTRVFSIHEDARGLVWLCTERGLFRYDGRDWWQFQEAAANWVQLGRADTLYTDSIPSEPDRRFPLRGVWRFHRGLSQWQRFEPGAAIWKIFADEVRSNEESAIRALLWADSVTAEIGLWDGTQFTVTGSMHAANLLMRHKISDTRIVDGGFPAVPRLPVGDSVWRYLALEPPEFVEPEQRPVWTREGRLLPPPLDHAAPPPGRYSLETPPSLSTFDEAVYAYPPAAQLWFEWEAKRPMSLLVRLKKQRSDEQIDPAILDHVWQGMQQVRPAGARTVLAVEEETVKVSD